MNFSKFLLPTKQMPMLWKERAAGGEGQQERQPSPGRSLPLPAPGWLFPASTNTALPTETLAGMLSLTSGLPAKQAHASP